MSRRDPLVSRRAAAVDASGIRRVFDLAAKLPDPINLSIGQPDFDVPDGAKRAAIAAIERGDNRYTQTQGTKPLREKLRGELTAEFGRDVGEVLITSGVSGGLLLSMLALVDPGDEVIWTDPCFVMYPHLMTLCGGVAVAVDSYPDFAFNADAIERAITPRTRALLLNSPANPTGVVMSEQQVREAVTVARRHDLLIVSDEIYATFVYDGDYFSPGKIYENTLVLRGFSKSHAMTGWRLGYAAGPAELIAAMARLQQYTFVCAPSPFQVAAAAALSIDMSAHVVDYRRKRDLVLNLLGDRFEIARPGGAFYAFPKVPGNETAASFAERAAAANVLIIPGGVFSRRDTHFRLSFATTDAKLREGCAILRALVS